MQLQQCSAPACCSITLLAHNSRPQHWVAELWWLEACRLVHTPHSCCMPTGVLHAHHIMREAHCSQSCSEDMHPSPRPLPSLQVDSGCDKELVFGDPTAPRFVYWENKLRATPSGPDALTFDLLSIWGKIRAGLGAVGLVKGGPMPGGYWGMLQC